MMITEYFLLLRRLLENRRGLSFIGICALLSLVWFALPHIGFTSLTLRLGITLGLLGAYLLYLLWRWWWARRSGNVLHKQLQAQTENLAGRQLEIELLKEKMAEAIANLKASELGINYRGNAALYALPWYMIIGPSAAGKSTLLRNSGLHFPFADRNEVSIKGFGGTRNCDWWFADEAILLDTAGRYTTEEDDHAEWRTFLTLLKRYRKRLPINGVIIVMSLVDILTNDAENIDWHVKVIRQRIEELSSELGHVFPIYLVFSKCDLLKGFPEFFHDLGDKEREQVWGVNLKDINQPEQRVTEFKQTLQELYVRLTQLRLHKLSIERDVIVKQKIYHFPEQFVAGSERISEFVRLLCKKNPYQEDPNVCGIYFTSGAQGGNLMQCLLENRQKKFEIVKNAAVAGAPNEYSYFVKNLFSSIIFSDQHAAFRNRQRTLTLRWLKSLCAIGAVGVLAGALALYSASLATNTALLHKGTRLSAQLTNAFAQSGTSRWEQLAAFKRTFDYYQRLISYKQKIPLHLRLGLYRGNGQLDDLQAMLLLSMIRLFLEPVGGALEQQLQHYIQQWPTNNPALQSQLRGDYYMTLKDYLMLSFPARINSVEGSDELSRSWQQVLQQQPVNERNRDLDDLSVLKPFTRFYLDYLANNPTTHPLARTWRFEKNILRTARSQLFLPTNSSNLYAQLRSRGLHQLALLTLRDLLAGHDSNLLQSDRTLPGFYTASAWRDFVQPAMDEIIQTESRGDWVINLPTDQLGQLNQTTPRQSTVNSTAQQSDIRINNNLRRDLRRFYFTEYSQAWFDFLASIKATPFLSLDDASKQLQILSSADGPLLRLLQITADNISIPDNTTVSLLHKITAGTVQNNLIPELSAPFADLRHYLLNDAKGNSNPLLNAYFKQLSALQGDLERLAAGADAGRDAESYAAKILSGSGSDSQLYRSSVAVNHLLDTVENPRVQTLLRHLFIAPIQESWRTVLHAGTAGLNQQWQNQVLSVYQQTISGKFPFARDGADADEASVANFFRPNDGILWSFVNTHLLAFLEQTAQGWQPRSWLSLGANFSPQFIQALSHAKRVSSGIFSRSGNAISIALQLYPIPTPGIAEILLESNGKNFRYRNGPQQWETLAWGADQTDDLETQLTAILAHDQSQAQLNYSGNWSLFKLLGAGNLSLQSDNVYQATWLLNSDNNHKITIHLLLKVAGSGDLLRDVLINPLTLPADLFNDAVN